MWEGVGSVAGGSVFLTLRPLPEIPKTKFLLPGVSKVTGGGYIKVPYSEAGVSVIPGVRRRAIRTKMGVV